MKVYLDNAATTRISPEVREAMMPFLNERFGNPSSIHGYGREAKAAIERCRKAIATMLGAVPGEIFFTSGGTESANTVICSLVYEDKVDTIITSPIEHHCVLHPIEHLAKKGRVKLLMPQLLPDGTINIDSLENLISQHKGHRTLVCLMHGNNEIGTLLDIERVGTICAQYDTLFFSDCVQTIAHFPIQYNTLNVHFAGGSAHKFHGPKGIGILYVNHNASLPAYLQGGAQERNMRAGTENVAGIIGMTKAMELAYETLDTDRIHILSLRNQLWNGIYQLIPQAEINGPQHNEGLFTVLNISFPEFKNSDFLIYNLDLKGIAVSAGSACSSGSDVGSHVMNALPDRQGKTAIRFSFSKYNTPEDIHYTLSVLSEFIA